MDTETPLEQSSAIVQNRPTDQVPIRRVVTTKKRKKKDGILVNKTKMDLFLEEYVKTNGNGTEAAMRVFDTTSRVNAATIAYTYLKRAQNIGRIVLEEKGMGYGNLIDMAKKRMEDPKAPDFVPLFDRMMKIGGYEDFITKHGVNKTTVSVLSMQKELLDEYVEGEVVPDEEE